MRAHGDCPDFQVVATSDDGQLVLRCAGELDMATTAVLRRETAAARSDVVIDFSAVTFCDSSGIALLLALAERLRGSGHTLRVTEVRAPVLMVFTITGVVDLLGVARHAARPVQPSSA
jgi:anti-sigma B factor antagonist